MFSLKRKLAIMISVALMLILAFTLTGCAGNSGSSDILHVGVDDSYPPMEFKDADAKTTIGFDADVARELAKRLGKKDVEFVSSDWAGIFDALETNKFDVVISSVSINDKRKEAHSLTNPYIANKQVIVTAKNNNSIKSPEDLKGKKVGVQESTTSHDMCNDLIKEGKMDADKLSSYPLVTEPFMDLETGRIDAIVVDVVVAKYYIANNKEKFNLAWESSDAEPMALCFKKKDTELRDKANNILDEMQKDGTMKSISEKWFGEDVTQNLQ